LSKLLELLTTAAVKSSSTRGRTITIRFGTNDIRDLSDGAYPLEIYRCGVARGQPFATQHCRVLKETRLQRAINSAASGSSSSATEEWVEIRTPAERANRAALSSPDDITT